MNKFILECWNPYRNKYEKFGEYSDIAFAEIMFDKPYFRTRTRRLIRVQTEILYKEKAENAKSCLSHT